MLLHFQCFFVNALKGFLVFWSSSEAIVSEVEWNVVKCQLIFCLIFSTEFNTTDEGKFTIKHYYASSRIVYTWNDAFLSCQSAGMRIATIESQDEITKLFKISQRKQKLFRTPLHIDGKFFSGKDTNDHPAPCSEYVLQHRVSYEVRPRSCDRGESGFLCEVVEVSDTFEGPDGKRALDVKATFFTLVGDYSNREIKNIYWK